MFVWNSIFDHAPVFKRFCLISGCPFFGYVLAPIVKLTRFQRFNCDSLVSVHINTNAIEIIAPLIYR